MLKHRQLTHGAVGASLIFAAALAGFPANAEGWLDPPVSGGAQLHRGLKAAEVEALVTTLKESGRIVIDIEGTEIRDCPRNAGSDCYRYDVVSTKNAGNRQWRLKVGLKQAAYGNLWTASKNQGMRPVDIEVTPVSWYANDWARQNARLSTRNEFAALFAENKEGHAWASYSRRTDLQYEDAYQKRVHEQGMTVADYEEYKDGEETVYAVIFVKDKARRPSISQRRITKDAYAQYRDDLMPKGFRPLFVNSVSDDRYAVTWLKDPEDGAEVFTTLQFAEMRNKHKALKQNGYARIDVEPRGWHSDGKYWGAIWLKPAPMLATPAVVFQPSSGAQLKNKERD